MDVGVGNEEAGRVQVPRVIVLTTHAERIGGIERVSRTLIRSLTDLYGAERVGLLSVWAQSTDQPCVVLHRGRGRDGERVGLVARIFFVSSALFNAMRWRGPLVVVACHPHLAPVAWLTRAVSSAPFAVWCHGEEVWSRLRPSVAWSLRRADAVFAPSRFTAQRVEDTAGLPAGSTRVIPHCLPPEFSSAKGSTRSGSKRVLTVARLEPRHAYKGVDRLIRAWPRVIAEVPDAELVIVGDGPDRSRLELLAQSVEARQTHFLGAHQDERLGARYADAAIFALPSRTRVVPTPEGEGFGLVYLEAAAASLPVVALRGGAVDEVVLDGRTGLLVDSDEPQPLAAALIRLLEDPALAARLGENGRRRVAAEFDFETFRNRVDALVTAILNRS